MKKKIALIFGVTGQDGAYLSKFLLKKNYKVYGVKRRSSSINTERICACIWFTSTKGMSNDNESDLANDVPTSRAPMSPGPLV